MESQPHPTQDWTLVPLDLAQPRPWRNGGGITRELLAWPDAHEWRARISVADVSKDGAFSCFEGVERWFAVLEGDGLSLRVDDARHSLLTTSEAFVFDGAASVHCELLSGATRDLNLMTRPDCGRMARVGSSGLAVHVRAGSLGAVYTHESPAQLGNELRLPPYHLAWSQLQAPLRATITGANAVWMEISL